MSLGGDFIANTFKAAKAGKEGGLEGLLVGGEHVLGVSNAIVPFEEGDLAATGSVSSDGQGRVAISYDTDYAVRQHEDLSLNHDPGREGKFLEKSLASERDRILQFIAEGIRRKMGL